MSKSQKNLVNKLNWHYNTYWNHILLQWNIDTDKISLLGITPKKILYLPNKVRRKSNGFSSPMLTDAKEFFRSKFCFLFVQVSAKPYILQIEKQIPQTSRKQSAKITHEHETLTLHPIDLSAKSCAKITNTLTNNNLSLDVKMIFPFRWPSITWTVQSVIFLLPPRI